MVALQYLNSKPLEAKIYSPSKTNLQITYILLEAHCCNSLTSCDGKLSKSINRPCCFFKSSQSHRVTFKTHKNVGSSSSDSDILWKIPNISMNSNSRAKLKLLFLMFTHQTVSTKYFRNYHSNVSFAIFEASFKSNIIFPFMESFTFHDRNQ